MGLAKTYQQNPLELGVRRCARLAPISCAFDRATTVHCCLQQPQSAFRAD